MKQACVYQKLVVFQLSLHLLGCLSGVRSPIGLPYSAIRKLIFRYLLYLVIQLLFQLHSLSSYVLHAALLSDICFLHPVHHSLSVIRVSRVSLSMFLILFISPDTSVPYGNTGFNASFIQFHFAVHSHYLLGQNTSII